MSSAGESRSYGVRAWADFRANRLAMAGMLVIGLVVLTAMLCPLLANQRPLYIRAAFQGDYENALAVLIEAMDQRLYEPTAEAGDPAALVRAVAEHLGPTDAAAFESAADAVLAAIASANTEAAAELLEGLQQWYDHEAVAQHRFPAFRTLLVWEIALLLYIPLLPLLRLIAPRRRVPWVVVVLGAAVLAMGLAWLIRWVSPAVQDSRPYAQMIGGEEFPAKGWRAVRAPVPFGENQNIIANARLAPTWAMPTAERPATMRDWHWLGTDTNGRDVLSRMIHGARVSMLVGVVSVAIYTLIGVVLGALAGYFQGWIDLALSRVIEVVICFPALMVILAVQAFLRPSLFNLVMALALLWWTGVARLQRGEFLRLANQDFVLSVRALGGSHLRIIFLHILPNALGPILVMVSFGIAGSIVVESALSFLGFGVPQPMASWGDLLNNGRNDVRGLWWLTVFPGLAIFMVVTCFNLVGEGVRDALDPRKD